MAVLDSNAYGHWTYLVRNGSAAMLLWIVHLPTLKTPADARRKKRLTLRRVSLKRISSQRRKPDVQLMTNSTPNLVTWLAEYKKYLGLIAEGAHTEAAALKEEIEEGLHWVDLSWADLEFANDPDQSQ